MAPRRLVVRAGRTAAERLRAEGFHPELFGTLVGASGGPKWLVLRHLDDVWVDRLVAPHGGPLDLLGSSIGSFRHACLAQDDPRAALTRFTEAYVGQDYGDAPPARPRPSRRAISKESDRILAHLLGEKGAVEIAASRRIRSHVVATHLVRGHAAEEGLRLRLALGRAALANLGSRRRLGRSFERILFGPQSPAIRYDDLPTRLLALSPDVVRPALLASGSIPLVMTAVRDVPGIPGALFDGGIVDYHFDFRFRRRPGLVLFPHFFDRITPGWFDKALPWRRPRPTDLDEVVMVAPSDEFVASLPGGRVPDRRDFLELRTAQRIRRWEDVLDRCRALADDWIDLVDGGRLADALEPFPG